MAKDKKKKKRTVVDVPQEVREALEQVERIVDAIDEEVPDWAHEKAPDFFEDVRKKTVEVGETITERNEVTEKQQSALDNWEAGVRKWIKD